MENVIVTGANGFIGKTLVNALLAKGCRVTALDVRFDDVLADDPRVTCISVLNKDVPALAKEIPAADYHCFFHLAWAGTSGPARADYDVQLSNVKLTCDYIKLCAEVGCKRVVYASSINEMETYEYLQSDDIDPAAEIGLGDLPFKGVNVSYDQFDLKKVERDTGYVNQIPFAQGIKMTADYIREEA